MVNRLGLKPQVERSDIRPTAKGADNPPLNSVKPAKPDTKEPKVGSTNKPEVKDVHGNTNTLTVMQKLPRTNMFGIIDPNPLETLDLDFDTAHPYDFSEGFLFIFNMFPYIRFLQFY